MRDCNQVKKNQACKQDLEKALGKMFAYRKFILKYLDKKELPHYLATIPIIESLYNEKAISEAGAIGLWQLMPFHIEKYKTKEKTIGNNKIEISPTAEGIVKYGFNPIINTKIAVNYFEYLFEIFKDQKDYEKLVIMSYNSGLSRIERWINNKSDIPDETINFYNKFLAIQHIIKNMDDLNIKPQKYRKIFLLDYILSFM